MRWFRAYTGISIDNKFLRVARTTGMNPSGVSGIWLALLDHACQASPRGTIHSFDVESYAIWAGLDEAVIQSVIDALGSKASGGVGMHQDGVLTNWEKRQTKDVTAVERKRRQRARERAGATTKKPVDSLDCHGVTRDITKSRLVTAEEREIEQSSSSHTSTSSCSSTTSPTIRDDTCAREMTSAEIWGALEQVGIPAGFITRGKHAAIVRSWIASGLTQERFTEAVATAKASRASAGTPGIPLNVGFLNSVITNPLGRTPRAQAKTYEDGDAISRRFAEG